MIRFLLRFCLFVLVLSTGAISYFYLTSLGSEKVTKEQHKQDLQKVLGHVAVTVTDTPTGSAEYKGQYVLFSYPAAAQKYEVEQEAGQKPPRLLEKFQFQEKNPPYFFTVSVEKGDNLSQLTDLSDITFRRNNSALYVESSGQIVGYPALLYTKSTDGAEKDAFILAKGKLYILSVTGQQLPVIEKVFTQVLHSLDLL